ncbi:MAG: SDR family NAD(P)-dependent oxidoreductase [Alphaproteobacteria bacterium]|nr:MAG: SDR family NAD(P)-dependent oxidoreductase [Alphaproteobacteria bacterium]
MKLAGRSAIITGASLGLGAEIAGHFATEGAALMLCARNAAELEAQRARLAVAHPKARIVTHRADVAIPADVDALFAAAATAFGRLDIVVNNAGVYGPMGSIDTIDWDEWVQAIAINLHGLVYCSRKAVEAFKPHRYGKIINLSGGGATNPLPGISAYAASKAAVVRFTETLALEVKEFGIDVNAVAPGALATRLTDQLVAAGPDRVGATLHERMSRLAQDGGTPLGVGASLCVYLASAESDGLTGRLIAAQWDPWPFGEDIKAKIDQSDIYTLRRIVPGDRGEPWDKK